VLGGLGKLLSGLRGLLGVMHLCSLYVYSYSVLAVCPMDDLPSLRSNLDM
jgi:hypothetical protein